VRVGGLWIGPPWETPPQGEVTIVIEPGQAFGTGAHPTTRLALTLLLRMPRASVLDVGCGSGVLAVAAAKAGFAPVHAVDVDAAAVDAARGNAAANDVSVTVEQRDALVGELPRSDLVVANITRDTVVALAARLSVARLVTSGYLAGEPLVLDGFRHLERVEEEGWAADAFERLRE
jgi:ribosomal protein L11 methyltransferase